MSTLEIPQEIVTQMVVQAQAEAPIEACGILAGCQGQVQELYKMKNTDQSSDHFTMAPEEQFAVIKEIRGKGLEMLAIYHSHPASEARPSKEDIRLAFTPDVQYVILSLQEPSDPQVRSFSIEDGEVCELAVTIIEKN